MQRYHPEDLSQQMPTYNHWILNLPPKHTFLALQQRNKSEDESKINRINKAVKNLTDQNFSEHNKSQKWLSINIIKD